MRTIEVKETYSVKDIVDIVFRMASAPVASAAPKTRERRVKYTTGLSGVFKRCQTAFKAMMSPKQAPPAPSGDGLRSLQESFHDLERLGFDPRQINTIRTLTENLRGHLTGIIETEGHPLSGSTVFEHLHQEYYLGLGMILPQGCERNPEEPQRYWEELYRDLARAFWKDIASAVREGTLSLAPQQQETRQRGAGPFATAARNPEPAV